MTRQEIIFDYKQAIKQAEKLEEIAGKLKTLSVDKIENSIGTLKAAWQSDSSSQYYSKVSKVQEDIKNTSEYVKRIANSIRTTAKAVKEAELRALEIAKSRTYR